MRRLSLTVLAGALGLLCASPAGARSGVFLGFGITHPPPGWYHPVPPPPAWPGYGYYLPPPPASCRAGAWVCPLPVPARPGDACACPTPGGLAWGRVEG